MDRHDPHFRDDRHESFFGREQLTKLRIGSGPKLLSSTHFPRSSRLVHGRFHSPVVRYYSCYSLLWIETLASPARRRTSPASVAAFEDALRRHAPPSLFSARLQGNNLSIYRYIYIYIYIYYYLVHAVSPSCLRVLIGLWSHYQDYGFRPMSDLDIILILSPQYYY